MTRAFARGFAEAIPLWLGTVPFGLVYAVLARVAGLPAWRGAPVWASVGLGLAVYLIGAGLTR